MACSACGRRREYRNRIQRPRHRGAKGAQSQFAVVARAHSLAHRRRSRRLQARQQDAALHLRAGNRRGVVDGVQRTAIDGQWRVAVGEREPRAHGFQRLANALHGPPRERLVADEREAPRLRREQAGNHAHRRAGVAAVERVRRRPHAPATPVISTDSAPVRFTFAPSASMQASVEAQSAPVEKFVKRERHRQSRPAWRSDG